MPYKDKVVRATKQRARYANDSAYKARCQASAKRSYNSETKYAAHIRRTYGLTLSEYKALVDAQENKCAICQRPHKNGYRLHVDHDHTTGKVRALLCYTCNGFLGWYEQQRESINNYLEQYKGDVK